MNGITFNQVRNLLDELKEQIPATEEVCTNYSMSTGYTDKDDYHEPFYFLSVKCGKIRVSLNVYGTILVSEADEQLKKGE